MKKIYRLILISILLLTSLFMPATSVSAEDFDFTTFTEVDPNSKITVTANTVTWLNQLGSDGNSGVYYDAGVDGYWYSTTWEFDIYADSNMADNTINFHWGVSTNSTPEYNGQPVSTTQSAFLGTDRSGSEIRISGRIKSNNGAYQPLWITGLSLDTTYYARVVLDKDVGSFGTWYFYVYSDSARTSLLGSGSQILYINGNYRYLFANVLSDLGTTALAGITSYMSNNVTADLPTVATGNATNIAYENEIVRYTATLNGTLTDDGGEVTACGFEYFELPSGNVSYSTTTYNSTGETFHADIVFLNENVTYQYRAYASNSGGVAYGDNQTFTTQAPASSPTMLTLSYPRYLDSENLSATLYGYVSWDGDSTSNVTGWIDYRLSTTENWTASTTNVTDLVSGSQYSVNVTGLSLDTYYDYRAAGLNDTGTGNASSYGTFILGLEVTPPTVVTGSVLSITDTTATLYGNVTDNGSASVFSYFEYRLAGAPAWTSTAGYYVDTGNFSRTLAGLAPQENYDYRAVGWNMDENYLQNFSYGNILQFATSPNISLPIMTTDNVSYLSAGTVSVWSTVQYDGGSFVNVWFQVREYGTTTWINSDYLLTGYRTGDEALWYVSGLENGSTYQIRSAGENAYGIGYGNIITFVMSDTIDVGGSTSNATAAGVDEFAQLVSGTRASLGLTGAMGTWAFMGLLLLIVAMLFGTVTFVTQDSTIKKALAIIWCLISITIVGGFVFTGELGIMPILVLVGAVVVGIIIIGGVLLSGNKAGV